MLFSILAWRTWGPSCLRYSFVFNPEYWLWFVCPLRTLLKNSLSHYLFPLTGGRTSVLGSQPIIWLLSPSPSGVRRPEVTKYQHLLISPLWPTFSLNGHFLTGFHCSFQREDSINLTSIVSVGYHVTLYKNVYWDNLYMHVYWDTRHENVY